MDFIFFKKTAVTIAILTALSGADSFAADEIHFDPHMLGISETSDDDLHGINLDYFSRKGGAAPGAYTVDIYVNNELQDTKVVHFVDNPQLPGHLRGQLTPSELRGFSVHLTDELKKIGEQDYLPNAISYYIPSASESFDVKKLRYDITIPQAYLDIKSRGDVDPALWNEGINALLLNYTYTGSRSSDKNDDSTEEYNFLGVHSGLNWGAWRLRYDGTLTNNKNSGRNDANDNENGYDGGSSDGTQWTSINTYLQRDVKFWQGGQLTIGQYSTPSSIFDTFQFTGAQLASDDDMLPDSMTQFAPVIRGIAKSNAQVTIRQNGSVVYQTYVSPGPFEIKDLYASGGGDLQVSVKESSGLVTQFTVPYTSLDVLQREGRIKYTMTGGKYRSGNSDTETPTFIQGTIDAGLAWGVTLFGGLNFADGYKAVGIGIGKDLGALGAIALDVIKATVDFRDDSSSEGTSLRAQYEKTLENIGTDLKITGTHNSENYYSFSDAQDYYSDSGSDIDNFNRTHVKNNKIQVTLTQPVKDLGSISLSGSEATYWNEPGKEKNWQVSWNGGLGSLSYSLSYAYTKNPGDNEPDEAVALNLSMPLRSLFSGNSSWANYGVNTNRHGDTTHQVGISGTGLEDNNLSYSFTQGYGNHGDGKSGDANLDYKGSYGEMNVGANYDNDGRQLNYGASGGILVHQNGITFSQFMNDTVALVRAPGAGDIDVVNNNGVKTDWRGYTVVPYLQPYRRERIELDARDLGSDVDIDRTTDKVIPTKGAVVLADFKTHIGRRAIISLTHNGHFIPFGADVTMRVPDSDVSGIVGENGEVYLTGLPESGDIVAQWGDSQKCTAHYALTDKNAENSADVAEISSLCK